jgi:ribokinase
MYNIITFGSATWDIFMRTKKFQVVKTKKFITGKGICLGLGSKVDVEDIKFSSGGGGTNTAATFANQKLKVAYCGMVGNDLAGETIIEKLKKLDIETRFVAKTRVKPTNHAVVLNPEKDDRTILVYRGASELLRKRDIPFSKLKAKWLYLAPLSGMLADFSDEIIDFAHKNKIKVAFNPGNSQLSLPFKIIKKILKKVDVLILNQEEASLLTGIDFQKEKEIFKKIDAICPGIAIMTKGSKGVTVSDGKHLYRANSLKIKVIDRTGAGDSFGAGFVSGFIKSKGDIKYAIQLGIANSSSCLTGWGAKANLLKQGERFEKVKVKKELCSKNGLCLIKK